MAPPDQPTSERRASPRVPHPVRAILSTRLGEVTADVVDLSEGGLGIEISGELRHSDFVRVLLPLAPEDNTSEWIHPDALVARVHAAPGGERSRLGLSFFQLPAATLRRIAACVASGLEPRPDASRNAAPPEPAVTAPAPSKAITRELPKAAAAPDPPATRSVTQASPPPTPKRDSPPHIPRTSARELRNLFHEALASLEEDTGRKK